jgi:hypothetical protein
VRGRVNFNHIGMDLIPRNRKINKPLNEQLTFAKSQGISISIGNGGWPYLKNKWVLASLAAVLASLLVFGGLKFYESRLRNSYNKIRNDIESREAQNNTEANKQTLAIQKTMASVDKLSVKHIYSSKFFSVLEKTTLPEVTWNNIEIDTKGSANLQGQAASYSLLAKQIVAFQDAKMGIDVSGLNLTRNGVEFSAKINFDPKILLKDFVQNSKP